jgi:hypothetical protein
MKRYPMQSPIRIRVPAGCGALGCDQRSDAITASRIPSMRHQRVSLTAIVLLAVIAPRASGQAQVMLLNDMMLDVNAVLMPTDSTYGREINGVTFQTEPLLTYDGYQYATWYHLGSDEDVYFGSTQSRRYLLGDVRHRQELRQRWRAFLGCARHHLTGRFRRWPVSFCLGYA